MQQLREGIRHKIPTQHIYTATEDENTWVNLRIYDKGVVFVSTPVCLFH